MICQAYMDIEQYRAHVAEHGLITKGYAGQDAANPMIKEIRRCEAMIQRCLSILGFSPSDRARLNLTEAQTKSTLQKMIAASRKG
jgi:P27 family predicted phage terminase small subunit